MPYSTAMASMEEAVQNILNGGSQQIWALEHPSLFTMGSSTKDQDWCTTPSIPVHSINRGGRITYHGPGQRILYVMLDLKQYQQDLHLYTHMLQQWIIATLGLLGVQAETDPDHIGVWVNTPQGQKAKIAALGVHVRKWVTSHGVALNISPDLSYYQQIVPCGVQEHGVTSLKALGITITLTEIDALLQQTFPQVMKEKYGTNTEFIKNKR
jgi:lipoyl(octanoyl) transferase